MYTILRCSIVIFVMIIASAVVVNAQFNLLSVEQINNDTLGTEQAGANILLTEQDRIVVAWGDVCLVCPYFDIYAVSSYDGGQTFSPKIKINDITGFAKIGEEGLVGMAENSAHEIVFSWTDMRHGTTNSDIFSRILKNNGSFTNPIRINDDQTFFNQYLPYITRVPGSNNLIAIWQDGRLCQSGCRAIFASRSTNGGYSWGANIRASNQPFGIETSSDCRPDVAAGTNGDIMVTFRNNVDFYREIYSARPNGEFTYFESIVRVDSSGWWLPACPRTGPATIQHSSGVWVCAYTDGRTGSYRIYASRSTDNGNSFGDEVMVGGDQWQDHPELIEIDNGALLLAFQENIDGQNNTRIVGAISYDVGVTWEPLFQISDNAVSMKSNAQLAYDGISQLYAVWTDTRNGDKDIYFAILEQSISSAEKRPELPESNSILGAYPNPFNARATISYTLSERSVINLAVYNIRGQRIATLADGVREAGRHTVAWNADDYPTGVYFARLEATGRSERIKLLLLK